MTRLTIREATRLLSVAFGVLCCLVAVVVALSLSRLRAESGVVKFETEIYRGVERNYAYVLWGDRVVLRPEPSNWPSPPREGASVTVLVGNRKSGMLKSAPALWRAWRWAVGFGAIGSGLCAVGLFVLRRQSSSHEIRNAQVG